MISPSNSMIYIDKKYWNIALLCLLVSAHRGNEDHQYFIENNLNINIVHDIYIDFNTTYLKRILPNSPLDILIKKINPQHTPLIGCSFDIFMNFIEEDDIHELFNTLIHASLLDRAKFIADISIVFNEDEITCADLSEGEKKKLLMKAVSDFVATENSLILLDEPDSHIHVEGKKEIYDFLKKTAVDYNRSIVITTHSPTLTNCADDKHIVTLKRNLDGFSEIVTYNNKQNLSHLTGGIWTPEERNIFFASNKPLILVEGKGDVDYIKSAIKILNYNLDINILPVGGAPNACSFIDGLAAISTEQKLIIMLFDRDEAGFKALGNCIRKGTNGGKNDNNTYKKDNIYYLLLPKLPGHTEQDFLIEDYFPIEFKKTKALEIASQGNGFFSKYTKDLKQSLKNALSTSDCHTEENLVGFQTLLDKIQEIINGTNIQNLIDIT